MTANRTMILCPGRRYGPQAPLLYLAQAAARTRGATVIPIEWSDAALADPRGVVEQVAEVLDALDTPTPPLLVGKSLASTAAVLAAERDLPAIWLTPLLDNEEVVTAIERSAAPCLLVGGTADSYWDAGTARRLSPHVCEVDGADHAMMIPDAPLARSAEALGTVATAIEAFCDRIVWPSPDLSA